MTPREYQQNLLRLRLGMNIGADAAAATGSIFLTSELARLDPVLRLPLENYTHYRDIPIVKGGGWMDFELAHNVDYRGPADGSSGTNSNDIREINFSLNQDTWRTFPYQANVNIPLIGMFKMQAAGKSPEDILNTAVRIDWQHTLDVRVYQGLTKENGAPGLINNPIVTAQSAPNTGSGSSILWANKTPLEIYNDFQTFSYTAWNNSAGSMQGIPNRFLIPGSQWSQLSQPMVVNSTPLALSVAEYFKKNGFPSTFGIDVEIYPLPTWLETAGAGSTRRLIAYRFDEDCLSFTILQDLTRQGGPLSVQQGGYPLTYVANTGVVKVNRPTTINYWDGI